MSKKFFTDVSPKAAKGIIRLYENEGYEVHAKPQSNGDFVVVVIDRDGSGRSAGGLFARFRRKPAQSAAA